MKIEVEIEVEVWDEQMQLLKGMADRGSSRELYVTRALPLILGQVLGLCSTMQGAVENHGTSMSQLSGASLHLFNFMSILVNSDFRHFPQFY